MTAIPILLDHRPRYLGGAGGRSSLLQLPLGRGTLLDELVARCSVVTPYSPIVMPFFEPDEQYRESMRECAEIDSVLSRDVFHDPLSRFDPADSLLIIAPERYPADGLSLESLAAVHEYDVRMVRHLLAFETSSLGTKELVQPGSQGRVRRVQRYFEPVTWPFAAAVLACRVPVNCLLTGPHVALISLDTLRARLSARGIPSHDIPHEGQLCDLMDEAGALALVERRVVAAAGRIGAVQRTPGAGVGITINGAPRRSGVHATARVLGPVSIGRGAVIREGALIVGPALVASGAQVGTNAVVAQCVVMSGASVADGATVRHRVVVARDQESDQTDERHDVRLRRYMRAVTGPLVARLGSRGYGAAKALVEPVIAGVALVLLSPLFAMVAAVIKLTSPGPVFYNALREGKDGRPFHCLKFRSMRSHADVYQRRLAAQQQMDGPQFKMDHDPRVTPVGWWLRRINFDELPQLINVLCGQMSLVGPRPSPFRENQICIPWRHMRLSVRPGITGLWQVCRRDRSAGDFHQWIYYDLLYIRHQSIVLDLKLMLATVLTLGGSRPAQLASLIREAESPYDALQPAPPPRSWLNRRRPLRHALGE